VSSPSAFVNASQMTTQRSSKCDDDDDDDGWQYW